MSRDSADVLDRVDREREAFLEELRDYIRIPSVSTDPAYAVEDPVDAQKNAKPDRPFVLDRLL